MPPRHSAPHWVVSRGLRRTGGESASRSAISSLLRTVARHADLIGIIPAGPGIAELVSMWVRHTTRGRGVGDLLVLAALRWATDHDFAQVQLWVAEGNDRAERLHARHGFQRTGSVQPVREGEDELEFAMVRSAP